MNHHHHHHWGQAQDQTNDYWMMMMNYWMMMMNYWMMMNLRSDNHPANYNYHRYYNTNNLPHHTLRQPESAAHHPPDDNKGDYTEPPRHIAPMYPAAHKHATLYHNSAYHTHRHTRICYQIARHHQIQKSPHSYTPRPTCD